MRRREFITLLGGAAAALPIAARAQQLERVRRVGMLTGYAEEDHEVRARVSAFEQALQELGWTSGRNIQFTYRWERGDAERMRVYAAELMDLAPDVVLTATTSALAAVRRETRTGPTPSRKLIGLPPGDHRAEGQHQLPLVLARHDVKRKVSARLGR